MSIGPTISKAERLAEILRRLADAPPVASHDEAYRLLCETIEAVEDELTTTPNIPANWMIDDRIYPPQPDSLRRVKGRGDLKKYVSKGHDTFIPDNGAITIALRDGVVVMSKPGTDGVGTGWGTMP